MKMMLGCCLFFLVSCSSSLKQEIDQDKSQLQGAMDREAMVSQAHFLFLESPYYTTEQKIALQNLMTETRLKSQSNSEQIYKSKLVLFQELFSSPSTKKDHLRQQSKIEELEKQLRALNQKKMDLMIDSLHESKKILDLSDEETQRKNYEFFIDRFKLTGN